MKTLTIYKSSAGSGKTYTLVKEYLRLVLKQPESFRNILAVTFTNKATAEMKQRIIDTLVNLSNGKNEDLAKELSGDLRIPLSQIKNNAESVLKKLLHQYDKFSVQTIDSFFNSIIRALALELKLPLQFDMEMNKDYVKAVIIEQLLSEIGKNAFLTNQLQNFALHKMSNSEGWNIETTLNQVADEIFKDSFRAHLQQFKINDGFIDLLHKVKNTFEVKMKNKADMFLKTMHENGLDHKDFYRGNSGPSKYFEKIANPDGYKSFIPNSYIQKVLEDNTWTSGSTKQGELINTLAQKQFNKLLSDVLQIYQDEFINYCTADALLRLSYVASVIYLLEEQLKKYRKENELLLMSDVNLVIAQFINQSDTPFVYEKTGNRFHYFLIDEYQDTSDFQWQNFVPLIVNSMGSGNRSLVVGDVKQSIYRWRGGNMKLLHHQIYSDLKAFSGSIEDINLDKNFRSKKSIINFNNILFSAAPSVLRSHINPEHVPLLNDTYNYDAVEQKVIEKHKDGGYVHVEFLDADKFTEIDKSAYSAKSEWKAVALEKMLNAIHDLISRGFNPGDIAILVRKNADGMEAANYLIANGFKKIVTPDSLLLKGNAQITLLISAMSYLAANNDEVALTAVVHEYCRLKKNTSGIDEHEQFNRQTEVSKMLAGKMQLLAQKHLYNITEELIELFELNIEPDTFIQRFLDLVLDFSEKNPATVSDFLTWWKENSDSDKCSVIMAESDDALRILSVHKSKGLQFPVVIMPFVEWNITPKPTEILWVTTNEKPFNNIGYFPVSVTSLLEHTHFSSYYTNEISQSLIDSVNMLYVALTRAEQQLYLFAPNPGKSTSESLNKASVLFYNLLQANKDWSEKLDSDLKIIEVGQPELKRTVVKEPQPEIQYLNSFCYNNWTEKIDIKIKSEKSGLKHLEEDKLEVGNIIHEALSKITTHSDIDHSIEVVLTQLSTSVLTPDLLRKHIENAIASCAGKNWFDGTYKIKTECDIILPDGNMKRPDRLMFKDNEVIILDYKTGMKENKHMEQIRGYESVLGLMGYDVAGKYLLYLEQNELIAVA